jgi:hypothetical protein
MVKELKSTETSANFAQRTPAWEEFHEVISTKEATQLAEKYRLMECAALRKPHAQLVSVRRRNIRSNGED